MVGKIVENSEKAQQKRRPTVVWGKPGGPAHGQKNRN